MDSRRKKKAPKYAATAVGVSRRHDRTIAGERKGRSKKRLKFVNKRKMWPATNWWR